MGGIYTLGVSPGTTLRNNHIHDVYNYASVSHGSGLYPDEGSSDILMENNVVYRVSTSPLFMHYGAECTVHNNILAYGGKGQLRRSREDKRCHYSATQNIVYSDHPQMLDGPWKNKDWHLEKNLYWCTSGEPLFAGRDFSTWQAEGNDKGSIIADPLFNDPANGDFTLKPDSPALTLGFKPIDLKQTGLYGDPGWVKLPQKFPDRKRNEIPPPEVVPLSINYSFEDSDPGNSPYDCEVLTSGSASVSISDESAAEGKQSLKFKDAPGLNQRWMPHVVYQCKYTNGVIQLSWDMMNSKELPADFIVELREYTGGSYLTGPVVSVNRNGEVKASGQAVATIPPGVWAHAEIQLTPGAKSPGNYHLKLTIPGQESITRVLPHSNPKFKNITWLGITSNSDSDASFYIDNLRMGTAEELAVPPRVRRRKPTAGKNGARPSLDNGMLAGYWRFDKNEGYTAMDSSGCANHGEIWARPALGEFGSAVFFDDSASHIRIPDAPALHPGKESFSISMWICPENLAVKSNDNRRRFISKNGFPKTWWNMNLTTGGAITVELSDDQNHHFGTSSQARLTEKKWVHLALVIDRKERVARIYLDGQLDAENKIPESFTGSMDVAGKDFYIGSTWQPFTGLLDDVKFYQRPLSEKEIAEEFEKQRAQYTSSKYRIQ